MNDPKRTHIPTTNATATTANAIHKTAAANANDKSHDAKSDA